MSPLELALSLLTGTVGTAGAWFWVRQHRHDELVSRLELQPQLDLILQELRYLRERLDRLPPTSP